MKEHLQSVLLDFPTFTFKARQKFLTEERFLKTQKKLQPLIINEIVHKERSFFNGDAGSNLYKWIMLHYTAGAPIATIMEMMKSYYYIAKSAFKEHGYDLDNLNYNEDLEAVLEYQESAEEGPFEHILNLMPYPIESIIAINPLAIAGFTEHKDMILKAMYLHCFWKIDNRYAYDECFEQYITTESLMRFFMEQNKDIDFPHSKSLTFEENELRIDLLKALRATSPEEVTKHLDNYLQNWFLISVKTSYGNEDMFIGHLAEAYPFHGYWAFEAAVVAHLKNIDDTPFHKYFYYPVDIYQHFNGKPDLVTPATDSYEQYAPSNLMPHDIATEYYESLDED